MAGDQTHGFGSLLRDYRVAAGLTQEALAERATVSVRAISDLERGVNQAPRGDTIRLLAEALGLSRRETDAFAAAARGVVPGRAAPARSSTGSERMPLADSVPLVGRAAEAALIARHSRGGTGPLLVFAGEPGIGKSRMLHEAARQAAHLGLPTLSGGCQQRHAQEPFAPLTEALGRYIEAQPPVRQRAILAGCAWLARIMPELHDGPIDALPAAPAPPLQERRLIFRAVERLLRNVAGASGILLVLDDLQWAGDDALDLLGTLIRATGDVPLRVVAAYRDTELDPNGSLAALLASLAGAGLVQHRKLAPLVADDAADLLAALTGDETIDAATRERLLLRAGGVPFFLVSCSDAMRQGDRLAGVPWTIAQSVRQRVSDLPEEVGAVLRAGTVIGRQMLADLLPEVTGLAPDTVLEAIDRACQAGLLIETGAGQHAFAHDVIREVLEADLGVARRAWLNRRMAEAIERSCAASGSAPPLPVERLAHHFAQAGDRRRAIDYLSRAADRARNAAAHAEEIAYLAQAIALADEAGDEAVGASLRARRGRAWFDAGRWREAREDLEAALARFGPTQAEAEARARVDLAMVCHWLFDVPATRQHAGAALAIADRLDRRDLAAEAMSAQAFAASSDGALQESLERYRSALALAGPRHRGALVASAEMSTLIHYWTGEHESAIVNGRDAVELAKAAGDTTSLARALADLGMALTAAGAYGEALATFGEARQFAAEQDLPQWQARAISMESWTHLTLFDYATAEALASEARERGMAIGWPLVVASAEIDLLIIAARRGEPGGAVDSLLASSARSAVEASGAHGWLWRLRHAQARTEIALARGDLPEALAAADESYARARQHGRPKYQILALAGRGQARVQAGQPTTARDDFEAAIALAREIDDPALLYHALSARTLALDDGQPDDRPNVIARMAAGIPAGPARERVLRGRMGGG